MKTTNILLLLILLLIVGVVSYNIHRNYVVSEYKAGWDKAYDDFARYDVNAFGIEPNPNNDKSYDYMRGYGDFKTEIAKRWHNSFR